MMRLCPSLLYPFDVFFSYLPAIYIFLIYYFFISNFLTPKSFYIGVQMINNVLVVSGEQRKDSAIHMHVSILPQAPLSSRLGSYF